MAPCPALVPREAGRAGGIDGKREFDRLEVLSGVQPGRLAVLHQTFFAPGHDARPWLRGWYPDTLRMQHEAAQAVPLADYWACGSAPMLEVFGTFDPFKPRAYWTELRDQFGDRVTSVPIDDASHALFPEQPEQVAAAVLPWLARFREAAPTPWNPTASPRVKSRPDIP